MKTSHIISILFLGALWLWLCWMLVTAGGWTPKTVFVIVASGIIVFVPLYKRYVRPNQDKRK